MTLDGLQEVAIKGSSHAPGPLYTLAEGERGSFVFLKTGRQATAAYLYTPWPTASTDFCVNVCARGPVKFFWRSVTVYIIPAAALGFLYTDTVCEAASEKNAGAAASWARPLGPAQKL